MHGSERLAAWRSEKGFSQGRLADMVGVTQNTISDWENRKKSPRIEHAAKLEELTRDDCGKPAVPVLSWMEQAPAAAAPSGSAA